MIATAVSLLGLVASIWAEDNTVVWPLLALLIFAGFNTRGFADWRTWSVFAVALIWLTLADAAYRANSLSPLLDQQEIRTSVIVDSLPRRGPDRSSWEVRSLSPDLPRRLILVTDADVPMVAGTCYSLRLHLRRLAGFSNPHQYDAYRQQQIERIGAVASLRSVSTVVPCAKQPVVWRWRLIHRYRKTLAASGASPEVQALMLALVSGIRSDMSNETGNMLRTVGVSHLLAISGLHVGLVAGFVWLLIRFALPLPGTLRHDIGGVMALIVALAYVWLAGFAIPATRALTMLACFVFAHWLRRRMTLPWQLAAAVLLTGIPHPLALTGASFALSFAAVTLLAVMLAVDRASLCRRRGTRIRVIRAQGLLSVGLLPVVAVWFGFFSMSGPLANLVFVPLFSFAIVPVVLVTACIAMLGCSWALPVLSLAARVISSTLDALAWVSRHGADVQPLPALSASAAVVLCIALTAGLLLRQFPVRTLCLLAGASLVRWQPAPLPYGCVQVTALDVGHGLAVHVAVADRHMLYDAGPAWRSGSDAGRRIVLPYLQGSAIRRLDTLVISHPDNDHAGGLASVLAGLPVTRTTYRDPHADLTCRAGQYWVWRGVAIRTVWPLAGVVDDSWSDNDRSCVLAIRAGRQNILLTGDIESAAERELVALKSVRASLLTVPHHGSRTSSGDAFVNASGAREVWVSNAWPGRWRLPAHSVRDRWRRSGAHLRDTGRHGALRARLCSDGTWQTASWRNRTDPAGLW